MSAIKDDKEKLRYDLIPPEILESLARIFTYGVKKYKKERNCELGFKQGRLFGALQRHVWTWWNNKDKDEESGYSHLDHALWNLAMMVVQEQRKTGEDDRSKIIKNEESLTFVNKYKKIKNIILQKIKKFI